MINTRTYYLKIVRIFHDRRIDNQFEFIVCNRNKLDSAPLSASLIADWLDVSGNMDPSELQALQQELEMGSPLVFADEFHEGQTTL